MNMSSPEGLKPRTLENTGTEEGLEDEVTEQIARTENPYAKSMPSPETSNREITDPGAPRTARFALAESGITNEAAISETAVRNADAAMEAGLIEDALNIVRTKVEAGRDPNELLEHIFAELQGVEDEIEDLMEGDQQTLLKEAEMRKARLVAQFRWLQSHLEQER